MAVDGGGALFVIRGDLSKIDADGCLISSDHRLKVGKRWSEVIRSERTAGSDQPPRSGVAPDDLRVTFDESAGARPGDRRKALILVTNVAINSAGGPQQAVRGMRAALEEAQERWNQEPPETLRARPLLAMPVVGVGRGGMAHKRGAVIKEVLEKLSDRLPDLCFDVVLVCRRGSDYAAVQHVRRASGLPGNSGPVGELGTHTDRVAEHARARSLSLLFGAGVSVSVSVSVSLGLPLWSQMLKDLATSASEPLDGLDGLDAMDAASLLFRDADAEKIREALKTMVTVNRLSLTHGLMGSLRPTVAVTTNYYRGYEIAMKGAYGVTPTVLPWSEPAQPGQPRLLKLHGDVGKKSIVLTREESVEMHAVRRPLTGLLQEQLLSGHVLVLGTSMSDATLAQAVSEARALREHVKNSRGTSETPGWVTQRMGTFVMHSSHPARQALFGTELSVVAAADGMAASAGAEDKARNVDPFLDRVAMTASDDLSYFADPRYDDLFREAKDEAVAEAQTIADRARKLREVIPDSDDQWRVIRDALEGIGATRKDNNDNAQSSGSLADAGKR